MMTEFMKRHGSLLKTLRVPQCAENTLYLSESLCTDDDAIQLAECLKENKSITRIFLSNNKIGDKGAKALADVLKENSNIKFLDLSANCIEDDGAEALAATNLQILKLKFNFIGDKGFQFFSKNKTLSNLDVSECRITDIGVVSIWDNESLESLDLSDNGIVGNGLEKCSYNKRLKKLYLNGNKISMDGLKYLSSNDTLKELYLSRVGLCDESAKQIANGLPSLEFLQLDDNNIEIEGLKELLKHKGLKKLGLAYNKVDSETEQRIELTRELDIDLDENPGSGNLEFLISIQSDINKWPLSEEKSLENKWISETMGEPMIFSSPQKNPKSEIAGELLTSFDELLLCELLSFHELEAPKKRYLVDLLNDPRYDCKTVEEYASEIDPIVGKRFCLLYSCKNPEKWNDAYMKQYKNSAISSYAERSTEDSDSMMISEKEHWLVNRAEGLVVDFLRKKEISSVNLTEKEKTFKEALLKCISENLENEKGGGSINEFEKEKEELDDIRKIEGTNLSTKDVQAVIDNVVQFTRKQDSPRIGRYSNEWQEIYKIIGQSPANAVPRDEKKMFDVFSAIQYKINHGCTWRELPREFPRATTVIHYYYEWMNNPRFLEILQQKSSWRYSNN